MYGRVSVRKDEPLDRYRVDPAVVRAYRIGHSTDADVPTQKTRETTQTSAAKRQLVPRSMSTSAERVVVVSEAIRFSPAPFSPRSAAIRRARLPYFRCRAR